MNKKNLLLLVFLLGSSILFAKQVDVNSAQEVASNFLYNKIKFRNASTPSLNLVYTAKSDSHLRSTADQIYYYVFNIGDNNGFIIVSADDINVPVIGYSKEGSYDTKNLPDNFVSWMKGVELGMADAISKGMEPSEAVRSEWNGYYSRSVSPGNPGGGDPGGGTEGSGDYLIKTKWNQDYPYNLSIPYRVNGNQRPVTGCVGIAMAQIMKYYEYPLSGREQTDKYLLDVPTWTWAASVNLPEYTYDWENMLNEYSRNEVSTDTQIQKDAVSLLMYHVGASIETKWGIISTSSCLNAMRSLNRNFNYDEDIFYVNRELYSDDDWSNLLKNEINNKRPVLYAGWESGVSIGHVFICDGYDENGLFHFNWGWGGYLDGYYCVNAPLGYKLDNNVIANIKPENNIEESPEHILTSLSLYKDTVLRNEQIGVNFYVKEANVHNRESNYYVALYSQTNEFVTIISQKVNGGYYCKIDRSVPAGTYKIEILEKNNGNYEKVKKSPTVNDVYLTVKNELKNHNLSMNSIGCNPSWGYPDAEVNITVGFINKLSSEAYIQIILMDENNNESIINSPVKENFGYTDYYDYRTYSCRLPNNILPGQYTIKAMAKEDDTNWEIIPHHYGTNDNIINYEIITDMSYYKITSIYPYNYSAKRNGSLPVNINYSSGIIEFEKVNNLKVALYDLNNNLVSILESEVWKNGNLVTGKVDENIAPGEYFIKIMEKTATNTYILANVSSPSVFQRTIVIEDEVVGCELEILNRTNFSASKTLASPGDYITASVSFGHTTSGGYSFKGDWAMALTDCEDNIKYVVGIWYNYSLQGGYYYNSFPFYFYLPNNIIPGNYKLRMVAKEVGKDWVVITNNGKDYPDYLDFTVTSTRSDLTGVEESTENLKISVYPNPVKEILNISSPKADIKKVTFMDLTGKVIFVDEVEEAEKNIPVQHLPQNTYILKVETSKGQSIYKINKE